MFVDRYGRNTILLVEDTLLIRMYVEELIRKIFKDVKVVTAKDGLEGLNFYRNNENIALIITDIKMPKMSGHVMAGQIMIIEEYTKRQKTPIIALTRYGDEQTKEKNKIVNIDFELDKPISESAFKDILQKLNFIN